MTSDRKTVDADYYFVPLGRKRGSYLDLLGLAPDATPDVVAKKSTQYRTDLTKSLKENRRTLKTKLQNREITQAEFDDEASRLDEQKTQREAELNRLKAAYDSMQAQRRKLQNEGQVDESVAWLEMFGSISGGRQVFWNTVRECRPIPDISRDLLDAVEARWIVGDKPVYLVPANGEGRECLEVVADSNGVSDKQAARIEAEFKQRLEQRHAQLSKELNARVERGDLNREERLSQLVKSKEQAEQQVALLGELKRQLNAAAHHDAKVAPASTTPTVAGAVPEASRLPSETSKPMRDVDLSTITALCTERDLIHLLAADALWGELRHTNREFWREKLGSWAMELASLSPWLAPDGKGNGIVSEHVEFPGLSRITNFVVDRLPCEQLEELSQQPDRNARRRQQQTVEAMLAALLGRNSASENSGADHVDGDSGGSEQSGKAEPTARDMAAFKALMDQLDALGKSGEE